MSPSPGRGPTCGCLHDSPAVRGVTRWGSGRARSNPVLRWLSARQATRTTARCCSGCSWCRTCSWGSSSPACPPSSRPEPAPTPGARDPGPARGGRSSRTCGRASPGKHWPARDPHTVTSLSPCPGGPCLSVGVEWTGQDTRPGGGWEQRRKGNLLVSTGQGEGALLRVPECPHSALAEWEDRKPQCPSTGERANCCIL